MPKLSESDRVYFNHLAARSPNEPDWLITIQKLMRLAKTANEEFEYDRAIEYLNTLEEIWESKNLPELSLELRFELYREKEKRMHRRDILIKQLKSIRRY